MLGFPTSHTGAPVSGSSRGSGSPQKHDAEVGWNIPHPLGRRMQNQGQSSSQNDPAAGNGDGLGPGGNFH